MPQEGLIGERKGGVKRELGTARAWTGSEDAGVMGKAGTYRLRFWLNLSGEGAWPAGGLTALRRSDSGFLLQLMYNILTIPVLVGGRMSV